MSRQWVLLLCVLLFSVRPVFAQTLPPEDEVIRDVSARAEHFNIVYLLDPTADIAPAVSVETIQTYFHAQPLDSWEDVVLYQEILPIDAMIIHASALSFVDYQWTTEAFKRGVVLAAFDIPAKDFAQIIGNERLEKRYQLVPDETTFFRAYQYGGGAGNGVGILSRQDERLSLIQGLIGDLEKVREQKRTFLRDLF